MKKILLLLGYVVLGLMPVAPAMGADYDLVINKGRGMDPETKYDQIADFGIKDGMITAKDSKVL
jgi:hypothetical protein